MGRWGGLEGESKHKPESSRPLPHRGCFKQIMPKLAPSSKVGQVMNLFEEILWRLIAYV
jgi:hypothetical protein